MLTDNTFTVTITNLTTEDEELSENSTRAKIIEQFKNNWPVKDWTHGFFFSEENLNDINMYWLQFTPPSTASFYTLAILYIFIMTFGIFGNCLVIFMYKRCKVLRTPANILVVNLAISDALMLGKMPVFIFNSFYKGPVLGDMACRIYGFVSGLTGIVSIITLAAISLDRYYVIKNPLSMEYTKIRINLSLMFAWLYAFSFSIVPFLNIGLGKYQYEGYLTSCSFDYLTENEPTRIFILIFFTAAWVVPVSMISFSYYNIVQVVRKTSWAKPTGDSFRHVKEKDLRKQEIKLAVMVLVVISLWVISWTPYATVALLGISGQKHLITPFGSMIPALFCKMASAVDPYVYAISHPKFRQELYKMLGIEEKKKTPKKSQVFSTEPKHSCKRPAFKKEEEEAEGIEEEVVQIELKPVNVEESPKKDLQAEDLQAKDRQAEDLQEQGKKFQRQASYANMLCPKPSFSNKSSSFRRLSRKLSSFSKSKEKQEEEKESKT